MVGIRPTPTVRGGRDGGLPIPRDRLLDAVRDGRQVLLAVAAPQEAAAVIRGVGGRRPEPLDDWVRHSLSDRLALVLSGVGKANGAGAVARTLTEGDAGVLILGLAGALPGSGLVAGDVVVAEACVLADEGVETPERFLSQGEVGFPALAPLGERFPVDAGWARALGPLADRRGAVATVSTCSGVDARAAEIARRTGALAEDMESAAVALVAHRVGVPCACLRVISNRTGDRAAQGWDLPRAFAALERIAAAL